jgi:hypothetical protein
VGRERDGGRCQGCLPPPPPQEGSRGRPRRGFREEEVGVERQVERREVGEERRGGEGRRMKAREFGGVW